ncbi:tyrosine-type recombinase/integrase [Alteribacillus sp. JSM 102045]|uniref:tyrosine-type recombinase/integrase n=1 Tax=Alteribacillus sp. JSM 102045 TaxID=1562101 RepID=UPI0035C11F5A
MTLNKKQSKKQEITSALQEMLSMYNIEDLKDATFDLFGIQSSYEKESDVKVPTMNEAIEIFIKSDHYALLSENTQRSYKSVIKELKQFVIKDPQFPNKGETPFTEVIFPTMTLMKYLKQAAKNHNTLNKKKAVLRKFIRTVVQDFYEENREVFGKALELSWKKNDLPKDYSPEQIHELLILSKHTSNGLRNYSIITTFLAAGIRLNELTQLQLKNIDVDNQMIEVFRKKRKNFQAEPTPIVSTGLEILMSYVHFMYGHLEDSWGALKKNHGDLYVFPKTAEKGFDGQRSIRRSLPVGKEPIEDRTIQYMVKALGRKATTITEEELINRCTHGFRHSFSLMGLRSGININSISKFLGHKSLASTEVYLNQTDEQMRQDIECHALSEFQVNYLRNWKGE